MNHVAKGIDPVDGSVVMEAEITGEVPTYPPINLELKVRNTLLHYKLLISMSLNIILNRGQNMCNVKL